MKISFLGFLHFTSKQTKSIVHIIKSSLWEDLDGLLGGLLAF
jgi:hypothetical protein